MKKLLALALVGLFAATASAGQFYINEPVENPTPIELAPSQTTSLDLYYNLLAGETLRGFQVYFTQASHDPTLEVVDAIGETVGDHNFDFDRSQAGMPQLPAANGEGIPLAQRAGVLNGYVGVAFDNDGADVLTGPMDGILLESIILHCLGEAPQWEIRTYNPTGEMPFDTRTAFQQESFADFTPIDPWVFPAPTPGFQQWINSGQEYPVLITQIPEPATLALLAFGGLALIRRK